MARAADAPSAAAFTVLEDDEPVQADAGPTPDAIPRSISLPPPAAQTSKVRTGCFIGCAALIGLFGILAAIGGDFQGGVGLIAFAGLVGVVGLLFSRRSTG